MNDPHRPDQPERDLALDAAWNAHSTELPPPHVDAAILAAAHREAHARPRGVGDETGTDVRRPAPAWWGLAAAATVGAITFGVLHLAPPIAVDEAATMATDVPRESQVAPPAADAARDAAVDPSLRSRSGAALTAQPDAAPGTTARPDPSRPAETDKRRAVEPRREPKQAAMASPGASAPAEPAPAMAPAPALREDTGVIARPFPGSVYVPPIAPSPATSPALQATQPSSPPYADVPRDTAGPQPLAMRERAAAAAKVESAPAPRRAEGDTAALTAEGATLRKARTPEAWIERIVALHAGQRFDEAARELGAFREAHADADSRLPPALRAWAASVRRAP